MRSALLGVCLGPDREHLRAYVRASTRLTHTDPKAERGAYLVALAAHFGAVHGPEGMQGETFLREAREMLPDASVLHSSALIRGVSSLVLQNPRIFRHLSQDFV